ncbi:uncharacterized protein LOC123565814 [Mercenaria mercenaria]|uniref:uncharacterized protein LOC123565814 n=1 Tax=Mercenaria mercenaria TaxID=6596 RepID=UPI00234F7244|nr:uncharacterized protein LOC123565814 [Mercenaria mercenaria]
MWTKIIPVLFVLLTTYAYPNGPPKSVCKDGMPVHVKDGKNVPPQNTSSPFVIDVNSTVVRPGDTIRIKVHSNQGEMFRGLFLQVHPIPNGADDEVKYEAAGLFDRKIKNVKIMTCRILLDTLTHKDSFMKIEANFDWRAPLYLTRDVVVRATILKNFDTYWHNVESPRIILLKEETSAVKNLEKPWLEEIIKTVKAEEDIKLRRELARARFERGFKKAIDPNGFIMINYVTNLLPFEDSPVPTAVISKDYSKGKNESTQEAPSGTISDNNELTNQNTSIDDAETFTDNKTGAGGKSDSDKSLFQNRTNFENKTMSKNIHGEEFSVGQVHTDDSYADLLNKTFDLTHTKNTPILERYYQVLVRSLLKGDKMVADTLGELIEQN